MWGGGMCVHDTIGPGEAGCCRQVAALYSDHYRQVLLYMIPLDQERLAAVDRWLPHTVTTIDMFHWSLHMLPQCATPPSVSFSPLPP